MTTAQINPDEFFDAYVECALWASTDTLPGHEDEEPVCLDSLDTTIHPDSLAVLRAQCDEFIAANTADLEEALNLYTVGDWTPSAQAGHDLWLTRNGHGAGFWDRGIGEVGERLSNACRYSDVNLYIGDDGLIYV